MIQFGALHRSEPGQKAARLIGIPLFPGQSHIGQTLDGQTQFESARGILAGKDLEVGIPHLADQTGGGVLCGRRQGGEGEQPESQSGARHSDSFQLGES